MCDVSNDGDQYTDFIPSVFCCVDVFFGMFRFCPITMSTNGSLLWRFCTLLSTFNSSARFLFVVRSVDDDSLALMDDSKVSPSMGEMFVGLKGLRETLFGEFKYGAPGRLKVCGVSFVPASAFVVTRILSTDTSPVFGRKIPTFSRKLIECLRSKGGGLPFCPSVAKDAPLRTEDPRALLL